MPRIENSQPGQPQEGNIQLIVIRAINDSPALYLEIPVNHISLLSVHPRKYLRYLGWCIMGVAGRVAKDSPQPEDNIGDEGDLEAGDVYSYHTAEGIDDDHLLRRAIHMNVINARSTPSRFTTHSQISEERRQFRETLEQRDVRCVMTALHEYHASHIIPYAHENAWIEIIVNSRANNDEVPNLTFNDVRNGVLVTQTIHSYLEARRIAFLKTPNPVLNMDDIHLNLNRHLLAGTNYPEGERFTLQLIEIFDAADIQIVEDWCPIGRNAAFANNSNIPKPSGLLLHYNYGAAAVKWWGQHTDILRSDRPPHPIPPPPHPPRRRRHRRQPPAPVAGPSTDVPSYLKPPPTTIHDRTISIRKRHPDENPTDSDSESMEWESWDEDDWMLFCRLNTKAVHDHLQAAKEGSSSNIRAWAQEVSDYQSTEL